METSVKHDLERSSKKKKKVLTYKTYFLQELKKKH